MHSRCINLFAPSGFSFGDSFEKQGMRTASLQTVLVQQPVAVDPDERRAWGLHSIVESAVQDFDAWLDAPAERSMEFMRQCAPEDFLVTA
jgi:hypothetical protein